MDMNFLTELPNKDYLLEIGKAAITVFSLKLMDALNAADLLLGEGIEAEVIDLRTLRPLDNQTVYSED